MQAALLRLLLEQIDVVTEPIPIIIVRLTMLHSTSSAKPLPVPWLIVVFLKLFPKAKTIVPVKLHEFESPSSL